MLNSFLTIYDKNLPSFQIRRSCVTRSKVIIIHSKFASRKPCFAINSVAIAWSPWLLVILHRFMADSIVNRVVITRKNLNQSNLKIFDPAYKHSVHSLKLLFGARCPHSLNGDPQTPLYYVKIRKLESLHLVRLEHLLLRPWRWQK